MVFESARTTSYRRSHSFTGLPYDTLFNITVIGNNVLGALSDFAITSVRTMAFKGAYVHTYQYSYIIYIVLHMYVFYVWIHYTICMYMHAYIIIGIHICENTYVCMYFLWYLTVNNNIDILQKMINVKFKILKGLRNVYIYISYKTYITKYFNNTLI